MYFDSNFIEVDSDVSDWQITIIGSGEGLVPGYQAITSTENDPDAYMRL